MDGGSFTGSKKVKGAINLSEGEMMRSCKLKSLIKLHVNALWKLEWFWATRLLHQKHQNRRRRVKSPVLSNSIEK